MASALITGANRGIGLAASLCEGLSLSRKANLPSCSRRRSCYVSIFGGVEHLRGRGMFARWKKSYCPIGADR